MHTIKTHLQHASLPYHTIFIFSVLWLITAAVNAVLIKTGFLPGAPLYFPISIFSGPEFHWRGLPYAIPFILLLYIALRYGPRMSGLHIWSMGLFLIVTGNLMLGGFEQAFIEPFTASDIQYYHDAVSVEDWDSFLGNFNSIQATLRDHSRTHPPFALLLHHLFLSAGNGSIAVISLSFVLLSSLTLIVIRQTILHLGGTPARAAQFALLFAVIPAINIYFAVSLDGVIALFSALWVWGAVLVLTNRSVIGGISLIVAGILLMNILTFIGLFLLAVTFLIAVREVFLYRRHMFTVALGIAAIIGMAGYLFFFSVFGYDHLRAFITASQLENPGGFFALAAPLKYIMTRLEDIFEIALFLSLGITGTLFSRHHLQLNLRDHRDDASALFHAAIIILACMFLVGAYKTGETARACLYLYPFFLPVLRSVNDRTLYLSTVLAGVQTMIMQLCGGYFW